MYSLAGAIHPTSLICYGVLHSLNDKGGISYIYCAVSFTHEAWGFATIRDAFYLVSYSTIDPRVWLAYGFANGIFLDGLYSLLGNTWTGGTAYYFATIRCYLYNC